MRTMSGMNSRPPENQSPQREVLTVSQLNRRARQLLETHLPLLWIEGEISNLSRPSSGHWYFTLKDAQAQIRCAMFRNRNMRVREAPQQGQKILVRARVSLYEGRGDYQLIVEHMEEAGFGALQRAYEELKHRLYQQGLFAAELKKPLPNLPNHIGVVTSPSGAAIRDIVTVLQRRFPSIPVSVFPVAVQGQDAAPQICQALDTANRLSACDVLILGRGGGSLEDLWPFNEESVAHAIANSRIPVISAVGHEVDITISDYVADMRAATPSAAAELATPDGNDMLQTFCGMEVLLEESAARQLQQLKQGLDSLRARLRHPGEKLQNQNQQLDHLEARLIQAINQQLQTANFKLENLQTRQSHLHPEMPIQQAQDRVQRLYKRLQTNTNNQLQMQRQRLTKTVELLDTVSPLNTLKRGYAIAADSQGNVIRNSQEVQVGDTVTTKLGEGELDCRVETVR
jgi:exodeoxyribonuclease VII large subunit